MDKMNVKLLNPKRMYPYSVILGIFCKFSADYNLSALYFFQDKTLHACSVYEIQEYNKIFDINDSEQKLISLLVMVHINLQQKLVLEGITIFFLF